MSVSESAPRLDSNVNVLAVARSDTSYRFLLERKRSRLASNVNIVSVTHAGFVKPAFLLEHLCSRLDSNVNVLAVARSDTSYRC